MGFEQGARWWWSGMQGRYARQRKWMLELALQAYIYVKIRDKRREIVQGGYGRLR